MNVPKAVNTFWNQFVVNKCNNHFVIVAKKNFQGVGKSHEWTEKSAKRRNKGANKKENTHTQFVYCNWCLKDGSKT